MPEGARDVRESTLVDRPTPRLDLPRPDDTIVIVDWLNCVLMRGEVVEQLPFNVHQLGKLARRDLARACSTFLENCDGSLSKVLRSLEKDPPSDWCQDFLPLLSWIGDELKSQEDGPHRQDLLNQLLSFENIVRSPIEVVKRQLEPGERIPEKLTRRLGPWLVLVGGEGDRVICLDKVELWEGSLLGYLTVSTDRVRGKRVRAPEQAAIRHAYGLLKEALERNGEDDPRSQVLLLRFNRLLSIANEDLPSTLERLETFSLEDRLAIWEELIDYQRRRAFPERRRPSFTVLLEHLSEQKLGLETPHIWRLLDIVSRLCSQFQPDPDVDTGLVQTTLDDLEEYLRWDSGIQLSKYCSETGCNLLNLALLRMSAGLPTGLPHGMELELIEFRESFLKRLYERRLDDLYSIDPAELLARRLERGRERTYPDGGDPERLLAAWEEFEGDVASVMNLALPAGEDGDEVEDTSSQGSGASVAIKPTRIRPSRVEADDDTVDEVDAETFFGLAEDSVSGLRVEPKPQSSRPLATAGAWLDGPDEVGPLHHTLVDELDGEVDYGVLEAPDAESEEEAHKAETEQIEIPALESEEDFAALNRADLLPPSLSMGEAIEDGSEADEPIPVLESEEDYEAIDRAFTLSIIDDEEIAEIIASVSPEDEDPDQPTVSIEPPASVRQDAPATTEIFASASEKPTGTLEVLEGASVEAEGSSEDSCGASEEDVSSSESSRMASEEAVSSSDAASGAQLQSAQRSEDEKKLLPEDGLEPQESSAESGGAAVREEEESIQDLAARFGLPIPPGMD